MDKLLPCPFCGTDEIVLVADMNHSSFAMCRNVNRGGLGPSKEHDAEAIEAWNRRATPDELLEDDEQ